MGVQYKRESTPIWAPRKSRQLSWYLGAVIAGAIFLVTPFCWAISIDAVATLAQHRPLAASLFARCVKSAAFRKVFLAYSLVELPFSIWYQLASRRVQQRVRHKPLDRSMLRQLMFQCCAVGTQHFDVARADAADAAAGIDAKQTVLTTQPSQNSKLNGSATTTTRPSKRNTPPLFPPGTRFDRTTEAEAERLRQRFNNWFFCNSLDEIKRDNVLEWLAWAILESKLAEVQHDVEALELLNDCVDAMESRLRWTFPPGRNQAVKCVQLSIDPVQVMSRPFGFYVVVNAYTFFVEQWIRRAHGVKRVRYGRTDFLVVPPRPAQQGDDPESLPILFLHGLGIGVGQYRFFFKHLVRHRPGAIIVVQPHISASIFDPNFLRPPMKEELTRDVKACILDSDLGKVKGPDGKEDRSFTIVSHSNGSMVHGWMLRAMPGWFKRNILVDPVCFRLWEGAVCNAFVYRKWADAVEVLLGYFVAREIGVAWTIGRFFRWTDMTLWAHEFEAASDDHVHVILAEKDMLVDVPGTVDYLDTAGVPNTVMKGYQ
ncbi:hypothetical protein OC845_003701, partial [Tilletia horrida]